MRLNRLKLQVPLLLAGFFVFLSLAILEWTQRRTLDEELEAERTLVQSLLLLIAGDLHLLTQDHPIHHFRDHLIQLSEKHSLCYAWIVDAQGAIAVSLKTEHEGQPWQQVLTREAPGLVPALSKALNQGGSEFSLERAEMTLLGVKALSQLPSASQETYLLVLVKDEDVLFARAQEKAWQVFFAYLAINLLVAGFLGILLHLLVTRRLQRLMKLIEGFSPEQALPLTSHPGQDEIGELEQALETMIQEKARVEQDKAENHADLALAQEIGLMGSFSWEIETNKLRWSDQFYRILDYVPGEFPPDRAKWNAALHPDDRPFMAQRRSQILSHQPFVEAVEHRIITHTGKLRHVYNRARWVHRPHAPAVLMGVIQDITQQKLLEHKLEHQQALLQQAQAIARLGSWSWNLQTSKVEWSDQVFAILGLNPETVQPSMDLMQSMVLPEDLPRMQAYRQNVLSDPNFNAPVEFRLRTAQGEVRQMFSRIKPEWEHGHVSLIHGVIQDITQAKQTEFALAESRQQLAQARAIAKVGSWSWDTETDKLIWSDEVYELFGLQPREMEPTMELWLKLVAEQDRPRLQARLLMLPKSRHERAEVEFTLYQLQGEKRYIYLLAQVEPQVGRPPRIGGIMQDITQRKLTEEALQRHKKTLETLLDHSPDIIVTLDEQNNITYLNRASDGSAAGRWMRTSVFELFHPEFHAALQSALAQARQGATGELMHQDREGRVWVSRIIPLSQTDHNQEVMIISSDESEIQRTLANLKVAQQEAERANRAKSEFLANMSHEIRTPLNAILGFSELLSSEPHDPKILSFSASIHHAGEHLLTLISDILDLSKIEAGMLEIQPTWVRLGHLLAELRQRVQPQAAAKGLGWFMELAPLPELVLVDENRLRQILQHLLDNALQFTNQGEIRLQVEAERQGGQIALTLTVQDTGIGIAPESQKEIFSSFYQVSTHKTKRTGGTGLGLAICHRLANMMGGSLSLTSTPDQGSSFRLYLPQLAAQDSVLAVEPVLPHPTTQGQRILVVDDLAENRLLLTESLKRIPCTVFEADSGKAALQLLESMTPDLVLMDLKMPGMDGVECATRIKEQANFQNLPIFAITASRPDLEWQNATSHLFAEVIFKPLSPKGLLAKVEGYLAPLPLGGPAPTAMPPAARLQARDRAQLVQQLAELTPAVAHLKQLIDLKKAEQMALELDNLANEQESASLGHIAKTLAKAAATCDIQGILDSLAMLERLQTDLSALPQND